VVKIYEALVIIIVLATSFRLFADFDPRVCVTLM